MVDGVSGSLMWEFSSLLHGLRVFCPCTGVFLLLGFVWGGGGGVGTFF